MSYPPCFENQQQFDEWVAADRNCYHKSNITPFCTDCTPSYAASMRLQGRCEHPEVKFYRYGNAFMGRVNEISRSGPREKPEGTWEPVEDEAESRAEKRRNRLQIPEPSRPPHWAKA